jgi:hypothetical protein
VAHSLGVDPVTSLESVREHGWVLGDARDDVVSTCSVDNMAIHLEYHEAFPFLVLPIP